MTKAPRVKRLNIYNTDRYFNINLMKKEDIARKIKVNRLNEEEIEREMDELASNPLKTPIGYMDRTNEKSYILYQEKYTNDRLIQKLFKHAGSVSYYTDTIVPYYIIEQISKNLTSEVIYPTKNSYENREIENVQLAFTACPVTIDCPVVLPDVSPYDVLFALHPLKTNVDKIQISFPCLTEEEFDTRHEEYYHKVGSHYEVKSEYKYKFFKYVQTSLSIWAMNIWLVCDSDEDYNKIDRYIQKEKIKRNANRERALKRKGNQDE
ncbi:hypothetical protein GMNKNHGO_00017 [Enterococcus phage vB_Efa29212_3e]|uniref:Uncharacterized protein n=2 Tax=Kochikohdavirus TaxID=2560160 RepID=A0A7T3JFG7_9CAUD|nr:hypothetical protein [Enterococcus phage PBEF129]UYB00644.1 hypothetical protein GMNKNHGO_00017 [Enterococcus phage vB_Efa29212_3e]